MISPELLSGLQVAAVCATLGWAVKVQTTVNNHAAIIEKLDQLLTLMLEDRLAHAPPRSSQEGFPHSLDDGDPWAPYEGDTRR